MTTATVTARREWAAKWPLPLVAMLGYAGTSCYTYSSGVFMVALTHEFGWSRAAFSTTFTLQTLLGLVILPYVGRLVDRFGSRRLALAGLGPFVLGFVLLSTANGSIFQWWALCLCLSVLSAFVGSSVWITAVARGFRTGRGLALATVLAGTGVSTAVWPLLAAFYIEQLGWRSAYPALALSWAVLILPLVFLFFRDSGGERTEAQAAEPTSAGERKAGLRSRTFVTLVAAGGLIASVTLGLTLHLVPILQEKGFSLIDAAKVTGLVGIFAIIGRFVTGYMLDRLPTRPVGVAVFLIPIPVAALLAYAGTGGATAAAAAVLLGFASGAETDVIVFLLAQRFSPKTLGVLYGTLLSVLALCAGLGPLLAGALFDATGSYGAYLIVAAPFTLLASALIWSVTGPATLAR